MKKSKEEILASFLKDIHGEWVSAIPELTDAFEEIRFVKGEYLTNNWVNSTSFQKVYLESI
ncbi:hypothetical protein [Sphingobacterium sp. IITKGP-BTPF85]|uniref:hypothetical protein n=1 Tax=Sphingobacterium sp. IITKGP-BTPF85 TaxID=1338009 RepID=UPI00041A7104|nr:hypothetical protein [Sphingobacterium sp. IITKGP-BTPF85]